MDQADQVRDIGPVLNPSMRAPHIQTAALIISVASPGSTHYPATKACAIHSINWWAANIQEQESSFDQAGRADKLNSACRCVCIATSLAISSSLPRVEAPKY
jgi:hypothetical protein